MSAAVSIPVYAPVPPRADQHDVITAAQDVVHADSDDACLDHAEFLCHCVDEEQWAQDRHILTALTGFTEWSETGRTHQYSADDREDAKVRVLAAARHYAAVILGAT